MDGANVTCWSVIRGASEGRASAREAFARRYEGVVRAYLEARWGRGPLRSEVSDGVQDVFVECFKPRGALERADPRRGAFRNYMHGVARTVALRREGVYARLSGASQILPEPPADEPDLEAVFDRAWARALLRQAARLQRERAQGEDRAERRVDLLRLRFRGDLPIREIAARWRVDPAWLHHEYATARREFEAALYEVVSFHRPDDTPGVIREECRRLILLVS